MTEEVLREAVARRGVRVEWNTRLVSLAQDGTGVRALLRHADGTEEIADASWLAGCDGGHSTVRRELGLTLAGDSTERWLIADAVVDMDLPADSLHLVHVGGGTVMAVPFPQENKWRLLDTVDTDHADDPRLIAARFSRKITAGSGVPARVHEPTWVSVFDIQQRMIDQMRLGRCLVAGDAAHVHSPASGQGLNTGVQDAFNLAWKLAMVVRGEAGETCLDTYAAERVPVGARLLDATRTATGLVALKNAVQAMAMPVAFAVIRNVPELQAAIERKIMRSMTALALDYADGPLTRRAPRRPGAPAGAAGRTGHRGGGERRGVAGVPGRTPRSPLDVAGARRTGGRRQLAGARREGARRLAVRTHRRRGRGHGPRRTGRPRRYRAPRSRAGVGGLAAGPPRRLPRGPRRPAHRGGAALHPPRTAPAGAHLVTGTATAVRTGSREWFSSGRLRGGGAGVDLGLKDRTVLVTGGSRGIGRAVALAFAGEGARVAVTYDTGAAAAREVAGLLGPQGLALRHSLTDPHAPEETLRELRERWKGGPDVLVAGALRRTRRRAPGEHFEDVPPPSGPRFWTTTWCAPCGRSSSCCPACGKAAGAGSR
nr:SDR family NAD(P)-dependent oxidoreductase [Streptomyces somaliensis]